MAELFFDTNVLLYVLSEDTAKADRAESLLARGGVISVQVLNEFASVARRKLNASWPLVRDVLDAFKTTLQIEPLSVSTHESALDLAERYLLGIYDAQILAAAIQAGCSVVYSEDMQNGLKVDAAVEILNPFTGPGG